MPWSSWKPKDRRRPPGAWRQFRIAVRVAGMAHRQAAVGSFIQGVRASELAGDEWGVSVQRDPGNPHHAHALRVIGHWTERRSRWFRSPRVERREEHIGFVPASMADELAKLGSSIPLAAELYEIAANEGSDEPGQMGVIIKIIVLIPSKNDPVWARQP